MTTVQEIDSVHVEQIVWDANSHTESKFRRIEEVGWLGDHRCWTSNVDAEADVVSMCQHGDLT